MFRDRRLTRADVATRTDALARWFADRGLGCRVERPALAGHASGQDHLAVYLQNRPEYLESMLAAWKARVAPFNVNYRYVADELRYLLGDAGASAIVVQSCFAPTLAAVLPSLPQLRVIVQVPDETEHGLLPGAVWYDDALAAAPTRPAAAPAQPRRSVHPLHRRHDRDAQGRAVAQRRRDGGVLRRLADGAHGRRARRRRCRRCAGARRAAVHARCRALGGAARVAGGWDGAPAVGSDAPRPGGRLGHGRAGADRARPDRRRRVRPAARRRARPPRLRPGQPERRSCPAAPPCRWG